MQLQSVPPRLEEQSNRSKVQKLALKDNLTSIEAGKWLKLRTEGDGRTPWIAEPTHVDGADFGVRTHDQETAEAVLKGRVDSDLERLSIETQQQAQQQQAQQQQAQQQQAQQQQAQQQQAQQQQAQQQQAQQQQAQQQQQPPRDFEQAYVRCSLRVDIGDEQYLYPALVHLRWLDATFYSLLEHQVTQFVTARIREPTQTYQSTGRVCLLEWNSKRGGLHELASVIVETDGDWARSVPKMIMKSTDVDAADRQLLEIHFEYRTFDFDESRGGPRKAVWDILDASAERSFLDRPFWSTKLLERVFHFRNDIVPHIIREDSRTWTDPVGSGSRLQSDEHRLTKFCRWLENKDLHLALAALIRCNNNMSGLYKLWESESTFCLGDFSNEDFVQRFGIASDAHSFTMSWGCFHPSNFPPSGILDVQNLGPKEVVPLRRQGSDLIGEGTFGQVYGVKIHGDFHQFSSNKSEGFAMKVIRGGEQSAAKAEKEIKTWTYLMRDKHPNIAKFYTSWTQHNCLYILSPRAETDLDKYLKMERFGNDYDIRGLLQQLEGVTDALQHIHQIGRAGLHYKDEKGERADFGYHHDLKPANILIFSDGTWKISDFGTVKLHHAISGTPSRLSPRTPNSAKGDRIYGGPDFYVIRDPNQGIGQEYDVWSLGCVFLEIIIWMFFDAADLRHFRRSRGNEAGDQCSEDLPRGSRCKRRKHKKAKRSRRGLGDSEKGRLPHGQAHAVLSGKRSHVHGLENFWYWCSPGQTCHLKPSVQEQLRRIQKEALATTTDKQGQPIRRWEWFYGFCGEIRKMLDCVPWNRPPVSTVLDTLGKLRVKAEVHRNDDRGGSVPPDHSWQGLRVDMSRSVLTNTSFDYSDSDDSEAPYPQAHAGKLQPGSRKRRRRLSSPLTSSPSDVANGSQATGTLAHKEFQDQDLVQLGTVPMLSEDGSRKKQDTPSRSTTCPGTPAINLTSAEIALLPTPKTITDNNLDRSEPEPSASRLDIPRVRFKRPRSSSP